MKITDEAIEAAARALDPHTMGSGGAVAEKFKDATRAEARRALEAAAPYLMSPVAKLADDMESAMSGGPEFIGKTGLRFNAIDRLRRIADV